MMLFRTKNPPSSSIICSLSRSNARFNLSHLSSSSTVETPPPKSSFMKDYLINSCGFSPERAAVVSKHISHVTSPSKPDSVTHFLKHHGFTPPEIRTLISNYPPIVCGNADRTMEPNLVAFRQIGFAEEDLRSLIARNPRALQLSSAISRFEFWKKFLDSDLKRVLFAFTRNRDLISLDIDKGAAPMIALLKEYDLNETTIKSLVIRGGGLMRKSTAFIESVIERVQEFGFPRGSPMFALALRSWSCLSSDTLKVKMELYRSFGWSKEELLSALQRNPGIVRYSEDNVRAKMAFLVEKAGCTLRYVSSRPTILCFSIEKRLAPRHHVIKILQSNELVAKELDLYYIMSQSDEFFKKRFIHTYKDKVPMLLETYVAACAGKIPL